MSRTNEVPEPANIEAERSVIGSILIEPGMMELVKLEPEAMYREAHQTIWQAMRTLWASGCHIDVTILADELNRMGKLQEVGSYAYLSDIISTTPTAMYADHYAGIVSKYYRLRRLIAMSREGVKRAYANDNPDELAAWYAEQLKALDLSQSASDLTLWQDSFDEFQAILDEKEQDLQAGVAGWKWPWATWNGVFGEAQPGMVIYVAGATGKGKTTFAENVSEFWAKQGKHIVFVHLELNKKVMWARRGARHTGLDSRKLLNNSLTPDERRKIAEADKGMKKWDGGLHYLPAPGKSAEWICQELDKLIQMNLCDGFVIDYMQKIAASQTQLRRFRSGNADIDIDANTMDIFKDFAEQRDQRCLILGQLTKAGNDDIKFSELTLGKLRGTQEIADKVNGVALFHREIMAAGMVDDSGREIVAPGGASPIVNIRIAKNTLGPEGVIEQRMIPERFLVTDIAQEARK